MGYVGRGLCRKGKGIRPSVEVTGGLDLVEERSQPR